MIRLDNISKQHGPQILFIEASAAILRGEKIGLVGPNGAGKSTVFRLIMGEESPDEGQERNRSRPVWCVEDGGMERRRRPSLDGKATHEDEPATLDT